MFQEKRNDVRLDSVEAFSCACNCMGIDCMCDCNGDVYALYGLFEASQSGTISSANCYIGLRV